jgi:hypothetical protein
MASFPDHYIPSREPGKVWRVHFSRPKGQGPTVTAHEGAKDVHGLFIPQSRFAGTGATGGKVARQVVTELARQLLTDMANEGYITADHAGEYLSRICHSIR